MALAEESAKSLNSCPLMSLIPHYAIVGTNVTVEKMFPGFVTELMSYVNLLLLASYK